MEPSVEIAQACALLTCVNNTLAEAGEDMSKFKPINDVQDHFYYATPYSPNGLIEAIQGLAKKCEECPTFKPLVPYIKEAAGFELFGKEPSANHHKCRLDAMKALLKCLAQNAYNLNYVDMIESSEHTYIMCNVMKQDADFIGAVDRAKASDDPTDKMFATQFSEAFLEKELPKNEKKIIDF